MSFAELRKRSKDIESVREDVAPNEGGGDGERYLSLGIDKAGVAWCKLRFLPSPEGERSPMVTTERFNFKNATGTKNYYALSLRNLVNPVDASKRQADPVQAYLDVLWKAGEKDLYRDRKKKSSTYVNVYVIEDKVNPENNGKTLLWRLPYDVHKMLQSAVKPEEDKYDKSKTPKAFNPFDIFGEAGGKDFIVRIKDKDGNNNYSESHFEERSSAFLDGDEEKMEAAWRAAHSLFHFVDPARHKTRDELIQLLIEVVGPDDKYLREVYADECDEFKTKGKSSSKKSEEKEKSPEPEPEKKEREEKIKKSAPVDDDDLDIDF